jgi:hypothetical protein
VLIHLFSFRLGSSYQISLNEVSNDTKAVELLPNNDDSLEKKRESAFTIHESKPAVAVCPKSDVCSKPAIVLSDEPASESADKPLQEYIFSIIQDRFDKQKLIDEGKYVKKGPGRNRKYQLTRTSQVRKLVDNFFIDGLNKLNGNKYNSIRTDA